MFKTIHIKKHERGLWFRRGDFVGVLYPGTFRVPFWKLAHEKIQVVNTTVTRFEQGLLVFWKGAGKVAWKTVDRRELIADVAGQEIMTADKVTLRVNLLVTYQVADAQRAVTAVADFNQALYREAQLVLRAAVGGKTL